MHYVDIITAQKKQENPREDRKAVTFISYFLVIRLLFLDEDIFQGLKEEDKDMIVNEISLVIQNIISFFYGLFFTLFFYSFRSCLFSSDLMIKEYNFMNSES